MLQSFYRKNHEVHYRNFSTLYNIIFRKFSNQNVSEEKGGGDMEWARAAVVHFYFRAGSTFPVPVCTVPHEHWVNKADNQQD